MIMIWLRGTRTTFDDVYEAEIIKQGISTTYIICDRISEAGGGGIYGGTGGLVYINQQKGEKVHIE